ncbi:MAG: hypothetical protein OEY49_12970, partial [Candidatus Heimdallarchaeota archaeon]|nr:hypothetical protein [Candidatus Heimdallarchaeota archaeon]
MNNNENMIIFISSQARELYSKDNYNVLCYPKNYIMQFRYRTEHIEDNLLKNLDYVENKKVLIVFGNLNTEKRTPEFFPVRIGIILNWYKIEERYFFKLSLTDEWVDYNALDKNAIQSKFFENPNLPDYTDDSEFLKGKLVREVISNIPTTSKKGSWSKLVDQLSLNPLYENALFYRINDITTINGKIIDITQFPGEIRRRVLKYRKEFRKKFNKYKNYEENGMNMKFRSFYKIRRNESYLLSMYFDYVRNIPINNNHELRINVSEEINFKDESIPLNFSQENININFEAIKSSQSVLAKFSITTEINTSRKLDCPEPELKFQISEGMFKIIIGAILLTFGDIAISILPRKDNNLDHNTIFLLIAAGILSSLGYIYLLISKK